MKKNWAILFITTLSIVLLSCQISLIPPYSKAVAADIGGLGKQVDKFYLNMLSKDKDKGMREFSKFEETYTDIQVEANALFEKNRVRPLNGNSARIAKSLSEIWADYTLDHKNRGVLSDAMIKLNAKTIADLLYTMQVAEKAKQ